MQRTNQITQLKKGGYPTPLHSFFSEHLGEIMTFPSNNQPYQQGSTLDLFRSAFEIAKMVTDEIEAIDRRNRYDDNLVKAVANATRLYEQGQLTHEAYIIIITQLTKKQQTVEVQPSAPMVEQSPTVDDLVNLLGKL